MRTTEEIKKAANVENLSREIFYHYFCDEYGQQYSGHPDELCVRRETVVEQFPETAEWPIVEENREGTGYVLGSGTYLFPDFSFEKPVFIAI
jgi:hypothetical protein